MLPKHLQIIAHLRQDARMPLTTISRKTQIPVSTIFDTLKSKEDDLIIKNTCLLNFSKLGYSTRANIHLKVEREDKDALREYLTKQNSANSVYKINNGYDFMVGGVFRSMKEMEEFIDDLEKKFRITDKKFFFIIEEIAKEIFMSNPNSLLFNDYDLSNKNRGQSK